LRASPGAVLIDMLERVRSGREVFFEYVTTVGDVMNRTMRPLTLDDRVEKVWERLHDSGVGAMPVVEVERDRDRKKPARYIQIGTVHTEDLALALSHFAGSLSQRESDEKVLKQWIGMGRYLRRRTQTATEDTPLFEAVTMMLRDNLEVLPVVRGEDNVGTLTMLDLLNCFRLLDTIRRARQTDEPEPTRLFDLLSQRDQSQPTDIMLGTFLGRVEEVMNPTMPTLRVEHRLVDAMRTMQEHRCRQVCVTDRNLRVKGVLSDVAIQQMLPPISLASPSAAVPERKPGMPTFAYDKDARDAQSALQERISTPMTAIHDRLAPDDDLMTAVEKLSDRHTIALPVVEPKHGRVVGVVTRIELLKVLNAVGELLNKREQSS